MKVLNISKVEFCNFLKGFEDRYIGAYVVTKSWTGYSKQSIIDSCEPDVIVNSGGMLYCADFAVKTPLLDE